jgi:hypothetical protein
MKRPEAARHAGIMRVMNIDSEFAGLLVAAGFLVMGVVGLDVGKLFVSSERTTDQGTSCSLFRLNLKLSFHETLSWLPYTLLAPIQGPLAPLHNLAIIAQSFGQGEYKPSRPARRFRSH